MQIVEPGKELLSMLQWKVCGIDAGTISLSEHSAKVGGSRFADAEIVKSLTRYVAEARLAIQPWNGG